MEGLGYVLLLGMMQCKRERSSQKALLGAKKGMTALQLEQILLLSGRPGNNVLARPYADCTISAGTLQRSWDAGAVLYSSRPSLDLWLG